MVTHHNHRRNTFAELCHRAHLPVRVEVGYGLSGDHINTRPADVLVQVWDRGKPAAFDITVTSPLTPATLRDTSTLQGQQLMLQNVENIPPMMPGVRSWGGCASHWL